MSYRICLFALKVLCWLIGHLPLSLALAIGRGMGRLTFYADRRHRRIAIENITAALGKENPYQEIAGMAREVFENLGMNLMEFFRLPSLKAEALNGYVTHDGFENFVRAKEKGKGVIFLTAHLGNWELMAVAYALWGYPIDIVVRGMDSPYLDDFIGWVRTRCGNRIIGKKASMRKLLESLKGGGMVGILLDQNVTWSEGVFVDFFGRLACTNKGLALLAMGSGAPVIPTFIVRKGNGKHEVIVGEEVGVKITGDKKRDVLENTARFTKVIEDFIRQYPEQWFWLHQRWKSCPEGDPHKGRRGEAAVMVKG